MLEIKTENGKLYGLLTETNRLNATVAPEIKQQLTEALNDNGVEMVLNMKNIKFIDSTGIGTLISALKTAREHEGSFILCEIQSEVMSLLSLMKLDKVFDIFPDESLCK